MQDTNATDAVRESDPGGLNDSGKHRHQTTLPEPDTLTQFQFHLLGILADGPQYGLGIKGDLEDYYGKETNHGRLYPNLDTLVDKGFVEKSELDKRTNQYEITDQGRAFLEREYSRLRSQLRAGQEVQG